MTMEFSLLLKSFAASGRYYYARLLCLGRNKMVQSYMGIIILHILLL
jgi:hypothetical protein